MALLECNPAIVTGAARGIGRAIALELARFGASLACVDKDADGAQRTAAAIVESGGAAQAFALDVTDRAAVLQVVSMIEGALGPIAILVNNAGVFRRGLSTTEEGARAWEACLAVNAAGPLAMTLACLDGLAKTRGSIVNVVSVRGVTVPKEATAYAASKGVLYRMTAALAVELAQRGIRVNGVSPGDVRTEMNDLAADDPVTLQRIPLGRFADAGEVASVVAFLASPLARRITGVVLPVDGGFLAT